MENKKKQILDIFYHDTVIHDIFISFNEKSEIYDVVFFLENEEYGYVKCIISNAIFINIKKTLIQVGATDVILDIEESIDGFIPDVLFNYIEYQKQKSKMYHYLFYKIFTNTGSIIELYLESKNITVEPLS